MSIWSIPLGLMVARELNVQVRRLRIKRGLTQRELGVRVGKTSFTVYRWEAGIRNIPEKMVRPLAKALGVSVGALYGERDAA